MHSSVEQKQRKNRKVWKLLRRLYDSNGQKIIKDRNDLNYLIKITFQSSLLVVKSFYFYTRYIPNCNYISIEISHQKTMCIKVFLLFFYVMWTELKYSDIAWYELSFDQTFLIIRFLHQNNLFSNWLCPLDVKIS